MPSQFLEGTMAMPNIKFISIEEEPDRWPRDFDDVRRNPSRLMFHKDFARLGTIKSYDSAKRLEQKLPPPVSLPSGKKAWEGRHYLQALGVSLELTDDAKTPDAGRAVPAADCG
jgi:hypothetical protein